MRTLGSESGRQTRSCSRSSMTKVDRSSPTAGPKISSALSTRPAESSFAFSKRAAREANRLSGYGHVDNARALPTCPQPQQQIQKPNQGSISQELLNRPKAEGSGYGHGGARAGAGLARTPSSRRETAVKGRRITLATGADGPSPSKLRAHRARAQGS